MRPPGVRETRRERRAAWRRGQRRGGPGAPPSVTTVAAADLLAEALERLATARRQHDALAADVSAIAAVIRAGRVPVLSGGGAR